jgi:hypothetical protein
MQSVNPPDKTPTSASEIKTKPSPTRRVHEMRLHARTKYTRSRSRPVLSDKAVTIRYRTYSISQRSAVRCIITLQIAYMSEISSRPLFPLTTDHKSYHIIIFPIWKKEKYVQHKYKQALPRQRETSTSEVFGRDIWFEATARTSPLVTWEVVRHIFLKLSK